ncbi:hypothetical protein K439DRAFT_1623567 [Ramaria rubella]|nr:hypothetical protein K439DRAFT_1623567 [Ramaria rubella]
MINEELPPGQKMRLQDLQKITLGTSSHHEMPDHEMSDMIASLEEKRLRERKGIRSCPMAHARDVGATTARIQAELKDLGACCGTSSLAMTVCTEATQSNAPIVHHDEISRDFIELLFGMDFDEFAVKFEAYALFRVQGIAKNSNERKTMTKRLVCAMVKCGLHKVTGDNSLVMEWKWYEMKIVNEHQVELMGWPVKEFDPHVLGVKDLELCMQALSELAPTCFWCKLSSNKLTERQNVVAKKKASGEIVMKHRKRRLDAGKKWGSYKGKCKK